MLIQKLQLKNFKRFTDLTIDLTGETATPKLVLLIGANGSGKSCIFDGFNIITSYNYLHEFKPNNKNSAYYVKDKSVLGKCKLEAIFPYEGCDAKLVVEASENIKETSYYTELSRDNIVSWQYIKEKGEKISDTLRKHSHILDSFRIYGRNSIKTVPTLALPEQINFVKTVEQNLDNPDNINQRDEKSKANFYYYQNQKDKFLKDNRNLRVDQAEFEFYKDFRESIDNIFAKQIQKLTFVETRRRSTNIEADSFIFKKGNNEVEYELLSMGEKQTIDTILDIIVRPERYTDSIVYFDELDLHLHTDLQYDLMKEIMRLLEPLNSQVWVASHSLGFIEYAREYEQGVIIDLDNLDFDEEQTLLPSDGNGRSIMELALGNEFLERIERELEQAKNQNLYPIFSEGYNKNYLKFANKILGYNLPLYFIDGGGENNLKQHFGSVKNNAELTFHLFDGDVDLSKTKSENSHFVLQFTQNINCFAFKGIENCFDKSLITPENRTKFYKFVVGDYGENQEKFQKTPFEDFILDRNNPSDFVNFKAIFDQIQDIINLKL